MTNYSLQTLLLAVAVAVLAGCGHSSQPPTTEEITKALKAVNEKPAQPGMDGAVTVEVKSVELGRPRKWHFEDGGDATPDTDLWPARIHCLIKTHYRTRTLVFDWDKPFSIFKNGLGEWIVSISSGGADHSTSYDAPADLK